MAYYLEAIKAAVAVGPSRDLKPALDFIMEQATEDYKAGALDVVELDDILGEYEAAVLETGAAHYQ